MGDCVTASQEMVERTERSTIECARSLFKIDVDDPQIKAFIKHQSNVLAQERAYSLSLNNLLHTPAYIHRLDKDHDVE